MPTTLMNNQYLLQIILQHNKLQEITMFITL